MPKPRPSSAPAMKIFRTVVLAKNVGKTVASTKKMIQWGLFFDGAEHVVMLKHSVVSGKKIIFFDKQIAFESKTFSSTLNHDFRIAKINAHMDVSQDSEGFLYNLIVDGVNYGDLPHMDRIAVNKALEAGKKGKAKAKEIEVEQEEEEDEPEPEPEPEPEEVDEGPGKKPAKKAPAKKAPVKKAAPKKKVVKKVIAAAKDVNVFDLEEGEDLSSMTQDQSLDDMMARLTMKIDPDMIAKYQAHQKEEQKKEENFDSFGGLVDLGSGFSKKFTEAPKPKTVGASALETKKVLAKPNAALQGTTYGMGKPTMGFGSAQVDEFGNPLGPVRTQNTTSVDMAFGMGGMQGGMGMGGMGGMQGGMGMGGMQGGMGMGGMGGNMYGQGMGGMQGGMGGMQGGMGMGGMQGGMGGNMYGQGGGFGGF